MSNRIAFAVALCVTLPSGLVQAQEKGTAFQVEQYEPLPLQHRSVGNLAATEPIGHLSPSFGVTLHFVDDPIEVRTEGEVTNRLVDEQLKAELLAGVGFFGVADVGLALPLVLHQSGGDLTGFGNPDGASSFAIADARLVPRVRVVRPEWARGVGVAILLPLYLPIGDDDSFNGDGGVRVEPRVAVDWSHEIGLRVLANLGYQVRATQQASTYQSDDMVRWGLGAEVPVGLEMLRATAALFGSATLASEGTRKSPVEGQLGVRASVLPTLLVHGALGAGLTSSVGSPDFRLVAGVEWTPAMTRDRDGDGRLNAADECPKDAEDLDGFQDEDGCPDLDNDEDGVPDASDACKLEPEDIDAFEDKDGCPEADNDDDGLLDDDDRCPFRAGPMENEGCPPQDTDGDGKFDHAEACADAPEDVDGWEDDDGCPEVDNDFDGLLDAADQCPIEAEVYNGKTDDDGCADEPASRIRPAELEIELLEQLDFGSGTDPRWTARRVLNHVGDAMNRNAWAKRFRIEVHVPGDDEALALGRAEAVREYLVKSRNVAADRIVVSTKTGSDERTIVHIETTEPPADEPPAEEPPADEPPAEEEEEEDEEDGGGFDFTEGAE